jgi:hypothetical protein
VTRRTLAVDAVAAILLAALWLIIAAGLAIVAISVLAVLVVCAISFMIDARRRRAGARTRRRR